MSADPNLNTGMSDFASRLRSARRQSGLTQAQLAERVGVTTRTYERWESGEVIPSSRNLARLARALNVPAARLTEDHEIQTLLRQILRALARIEAKLDERD